MRELAAFGTVGAVAFVVDTGFFNLLRSHEASPLSHKPLTDEIISAGAATSLSWVGNRWWTHRHQRREALRPELLLFGVMDGLALIIGVGLGTASRSLACRTWVFKSRDGAIDLEEGRDVPPGGRLAASKPAKIVDRTSTPVSTSTISRTSTVFASSPGRTAPVIFTAAALAAATATEDCS